jgi:mRNA interferase MazF
MAQKYQFGDIVLIEYPYSDGLREKLRPALVVLVQPDGDILFARITSKASKTIGDVLLKDWQTASLMTPSLVRTEKLSTLLASRIQEKIGNLSNSDCIIVANMFSELFANLQ